MTSERPGRRSEPGQTERSSVPPELDSILHGGADKRFGPWVENFERLAQRAAAEPAFYEIAGRNVQALADAIREGRWPE